MPAFNFRLETVSRWRQSLRDQCRADLAAALVASGQAQSALDAILELLGDARQRQRAVGTTIDLEGRRALDRYEALLRARRAAVEHDLAHTAAEVVRRRELLLEADRELRVLEKLREKQFERYHIAVSRQDAMELDEIASRKNALGLGS